GVAEVAVSGWPERGRVEWSATRDGRDLSWWADLRQGFSQRAQVSGTGKTRLGEVIDWAVAGGAKPDGADPDLYADDIHARLALRGTRVQSLLQLAGANRTAEGELLGGFTVKGAATHPVVSGGANWVGAQLGQVQIPGAYVSLVPRKGGLPGYDADLEVQF